MPRNDGSEVAEREELNVFHLSKLQGQLKRAKSQSVDGYRQLGESLRLLGECRDLFELVMDTQLHEQIQALIARIDSFCPRGENK